ncbi:MBL fold metallo-hydrolase [Aliarcobacter cryaerophilus]|uniref:MBL fold metallo-hydrolase n=1 Tax=Aliarcobacter cryaerophilus TaxID=28198 RepID=UPI0011DF5953|nr:MBL fold metallo-hydrolase [Aliarcobacter cryaerophilus]
MIFQQFIDTDLGHVSYIVACIECRECFIVDPRRDIKEYVEFIERNSLKLKYIFNTHTHADYIGGHIELSSRYSIKNIFQELTPIENFDIVRAKENDQFYLCNNIKIKILETPGHTPFDICLLVSENNTEKYLFTGDFLFVGDIGRPDLLGKDNLEFLLSSSFISANKIWELSDDIITFTSHIQGSLCGKNLSKQNFSTIGIEKQTNYSFKLCKQTKENYMENLISQNIEIPIFFKKMATINISGPKLIRDILKEIKKIEFEEIKERKDIQIIDLRDPKFFYKNHIKNSINISKNSNVSFIAGNIINYENDIYLIGDIDSYLDEFIIKFLRVGIDNIKGIINNDFSLIESKYLINSNMILDYEDFTNILLDKDCSTLGKNIIESDIIEVQNLDLSKYEKIIFSCNYGYKSSAIMSFLNFDNLFYIEK